MKKSKKFISLCAKLDVNPESIPEITSFEAACKITGDDPNALPDVSSFPERHQKHIMADHKLTIIAEALRGKKTANYNSSEGKYFSVFEVHADDKHPSGFGLSYDVCDDWASDSAVGVRLCFPNWNIAKYFGKQFIDLHTDYHLYT